MKRIMPLLLVTLLLSTLSVTISFGQVKSRIKNRDLVFDDAPKAPKNNMAADEVSITGIKITLELYRDGKKSMVLPSHVFKSGDRVKILYAANIDCFVYWLSEGTSGDYYMLFPNPKVGMDNWVKQNEIYSIPDKPGATFKFKGPTGVEKIILIVSPRKIDELEDAVREAAVKDGRITESTAQVAAVRENFRRLAGNRDLVFEEKEDPRKGVVTKIQTSQDNEQPMVININLLHE